MSTNLNLSTRSTSCDAHYPKTLGILRLRADNSDLKRDFEHSDDDNDEEVQGHDANKSWSELGKKRKKQLLSNISQEMGRLAQERRTGVGNIAARCQRLLA